jgi:hypothetical protein
MTVQRDLRSADEDPQPAAADLVNDKAWEHLGITGQEFRRRWWEGQYRDDDHPAVRALDTLMRTGYWQLP